MSKFVTITLQVDHLRVNIGREIMEFLGSRYVAIDLADMKIRGGGPLKPNAKNSVFLHNVPDMDKYVGKYVATFRDGHCSLAPHTPQGLSEKPFVSINIAGPKELRFRISRGVDLKKGTTHVEVDLKNMALVPFTDGNKTPNALKINERRQFVLYGVENIGKYVGRYEVKQDGVVWRLQGKKEVVKPTAAPKEEKRPGYPYAISFPGPMDRW